MGTTTLFCAKYPAVFLVALFRGYHTAILYKIPCGTWKSTFFQGILKKNARWYPWIHLALSYLAYFLPSNMKKSSFYGYFTKKGSLVPGIFNIYKFSRQYTRKFFTEATFCAWITIWYVIHPYILMSKYRHFPMSKYHHRPISSYSHIDMLPYRHAPISTCSHINISTHQYFPVLNTKE